MYYSRITGQFELTKIKLYVCAGRHGRIIRFIQYLAYVLIIITRGVTANIDIIYR